MFDIRTIMKNSLIIFLTSIIVLNFACTKEQEYIPEGKSNSIIPTENFLEIVWQQMVYDDTTGADFLSPLFSNNYVVFCAHGPWSSNDGGVGLVVLNRETGERHPAWNHEPDILNMAIADWDIGGENNDIIILNNQLNLYAYSVNTGNLIWEKMADDYFTPRISTFGKYIFATQEPSGPDTWSRLLAIDAASGKSREIIYEAMEDGYEFNYESPAAYIANTGDTILIFQKIQLNFSLSKGRVDIYAYNMTQDSLSWRVNDITESGISSVRDAIVTGDKYLFQGTNSIHCIDIISGQILWEDNIDGSSFAQHNNLYADGKVFLNSDGGYSICYDVNSGVQLWKNTTDYSYPSHGGSMAYYDGNLYLTAIPANPQVPEDIRQPLRCISAETGKTLWSTLGPGPGAATEGVIVDPITGYLYFNDMYSIICTDLNVKPNL